MPASLITRLPADRRTEILRKISANSRPIRGRFAPNTQLDVTKRGRLDSLRAPLTRAGIIPIHVTQAPGQASGAAYVHVYADERNGGVAVTVTAPGYSQVFGSINNALAASGLTPGTVDFAATCAADPAATGAGRAVIT